MPRANVGPEASQFFDGHHAVVHVEMAYKEYADNVSVAFPLDHVLKPEFNHRTSADILRITIDE